ncbi:MAG: nucleotidyl transferase AbiEii/AbiGii toxin family protein [Thermoanaerobaculia bacterium]|nr:nucleotidyl transferase AbiEii/AbiGii toxin family protein [Thermoanaerobaculia bacterium]
MNAYLSQQVRTSRSALEARNIAREVIQAKVLASLQRSGAMIPLAFHGGTALRFLFGIGRYSEDLDFALERSGRGYDFRAYLRQIESDLSNEGFSVELKVNDRKVVHSAFVRLRGLLFELGLSSHADEVLAVKIEVDTRPPAGAGLATTVFRRHETLHLQHHDRPSLLAGKLHALLQRSYTKGRDVYDLVWYLSDRSWPMPNLELLRNALQQTGWVGEIPDEGNWRVLVAARLRQLEWARVRTDLEPFLEAPREIDLISLENALQVLAV